MLYRYAAKVAVPLVLIVVFFWVLPVLAHKVNVFAYVEDNTVFTESYFPDGKKVEDGVIEVVNASGQTLLTGKTDKGGNFSFPLPAEKEDLTIILIATMGHRNSYLLKKSEM